MYPNPSPYMSVALLRIRRGVTTCCWTAGAALVVQVLVWCAATFTEVRSARIGEESDAAVLISPSSSSNGAAATAPVVSGKEPLVRPSGSRNGPTPADPNQGVSRFDPILATLSSLALAAGTLSVLILIILLMMGVLLGVSTAIPGVDEAVSAFLWGTLLVVLALPWGGAFGLPWRDGALATYTVMTHQVGLELSGSAWGGPAFYARFALLPLACISVLAMVGLRFSSGVRAGIMNGEQFRLDPALEQETAAIRPGSLHGGRAGQAMRAAALGMSVQPMPHDGPITQPVAGAAPRRLI